MALSDYMFFKIDDEDTSTWFDNSKYRLAIIVVTGKSFWERPYGKLNELTFDLTLTVVDQTTLQPVPMFNYTETICSKLYKKDFVKLQLYNQDCYYIGKFTGGKINSNYLNQSYFDVKFSCNKPYGYLNTRTEGFRQTSANEKVFTLECATSTQDIATMPRVTFYSKSTTNTKMYLLNNTTNEKIEFDFSKANANEKIRDGEVIVVDNNKKEITSNIDLNRYKYWNGEFFSLAPGVNNIVVFGNVEVQIKYTPTVRV